jgi:hypothetical protein
MHEFAQRMAEAFEDELKKLAAPKIPPKSTMLVPGLVAGSLGTLALQRAHHDWKMGRAMRMQNQSY